MFYNQIPWGMGAISALLLPENRKRSNFGSSVPVDDCSGTKNENQTKNEKKKRKKNRRKSNDKTPPDGKCYAADWKPRDDARYFILSPSLQRQTSPCAT